MFISTDVSGHVIKLEQDSFALEQSIDCREDYLVVYDGDIVSKWKSVILTQ